MSSDAPANDLKGSLQDLNAPCDIDESGRCGLTARNWATPEVPLHLPLLRAPSLFAEARCCDVCVTCVLLLLLRRLLRGVWQLLAETLPGTDSVAFAERQRRVMEEDELAVRNPSFRTGV